VPLLWGRNAGQRSEDWQKELEGKNGEVNEYEASSPCEVVTVETVGLGDRSYVVHDGAVAVVVDPQRDIDRFLELVDELGVQVTHVLETHLHNDYVTGGHALAEEVGAGYVVPAGDDVAFSRVPVVDGQQITTGRLGIVARHTPGHTPHHMSYVVRAGGEPLAVLTGGSMLYGAVGRTDLIGKEMTEELTRAQYRSVRCLAEELPGHVSVYPTHGFGSFCSATETSGDQSTIAEERTRNVALLIDDEEHFVDQLISGLTAYPRYYVHMAPRNAAGPSAPDLSNPDPVDGEVLRERVAAGEWVVDLRERRAFARGHLAGTVSIELGDTFSTYFGWTLPCQAPVTLIGDHPDQICQARRQLVRIGVDELFGAAVGSIETLAGGRTASYEVAKFEQLSSVFGTPGHVLLDVRRRDEWEVGHLSGALHIPFWELADRVDEIPVGKIWVHCASGFRASIAASIVDRAGYPCVFVDDDWGRAAELGIPVESGH
jgi:glyoxylase-like metal-dependent hydrolase (beta-lactamase superfamily II)/rhodanese-related sulfurtransferase